MTSKDTCVFSGLRTFLFAMCDNVGGGNQHMPKASIHLAPKFPAKDPQTTQERKCNESTKGEATHMKIWDYIEE